MKNKENAERPTSAIEESTSGFGLHRASGKLAQTVSSRAKSGSKISKPQQSTVPYVPS
jgi:hypothetical protein